MTDNLVKQFIEQLRLGGAGVQVRGDVCQALADAIAALTAERDRLREALGLDPWFLGRREWAMHIRFALKGETP